LLVVFDTAQSQNGDDLIIGTAVTLKSAILQKNIRLSIHVPENPTDRTRRYPVLYTFQTHFEQVAGAVKNLYDYSLIPEMMVVRIDNYEFGYLTPTVIPSNPNSGQAHKFLEFFERELIPFVDSSYGTHPYRVVFSNSWGAMFIAYTILSKPELFNAGIASIPWITYDGEERFILNSVKRFLETREYDNFLYMTMDDELDDLPDFPLFVGILRDNPVPGLGWEYRHWAEEDHSSTPYRSIYSGLRALYAAWNRIPEDVISKGMEEIRLYEATLKEQFGYDIGVSGSALQQAGQYLQKQSKYDSAIEVYEYAAEKDGDNAFAYVSLGRALEATNQLERAKEAYEAAYRLAEVTSHPQIKWIENFLDKVTKKIETRNK
jgi:predicted alpha/beta superfamily hydrolase